MELLKQVMPYLLSGLKITVLVSAFALVFSMLLGLVLALLKRNGAKCMGKIIDGYIKIFRNTPFMIQVYLAYNLPPLLGLHPKAIVLGTVILIMYEAAYLTVTFQMGFDAIPKGQEEAAIALDIPYLTRIRKILLPQVMKVILPTVTSILIVTVKDSSLLSVITITELTMEASRCASITFLPFEVYIIAGVLYWILNMLIELVMKLFSQKYLAY